MLMRLGLVARLIREELPNPISATHKQATKADHIRIESQIVSSIHLNLVRQPPLPDRWIMAAAKNILWWKKAGSEHQMRVERLQQWHTDHHVQCMRHAE